VTKSLFLYGHRASLDDKPGLALTKKYAGELLPTIVFCIEPALKDLQTLRKS
jgi:hypothetical protein